MTHEACCHVPRLLRRLVSQGPFVLKTCRRASRRVLFVCLCQSELSLKHFRKEKAMKARCARIAFEFTLAHVRTVGNLKMLEAPFFVRFLQYCTRFHCGNPTQERIKCSLRVQQNFGFVTLESSLFESSCGQFPMLDGVSLSILGARQRTQLCHACQGLGPCT